MSTEAERAIQQALEIFNLSASLANGVKNTIQRTAEHHENIESDGELTPDEEEPATRTKSSKTSDDEDENDTYLRYADDYIRFTYKNPTTYHVVYYFSKLLEANGFKFLSERQSWDNLRPGFYYTTRNGTNLAAFGVGKGWKPEYGSGIIGSHIDALAAKLKPISLKPSIEGYDMLGVAPYAGALSPLWFDRDLGLAGRVLIKVNGKIVSKLVDSSPKPIARISTLAPHFGAVSDPPYDKEVIAVPMIGYNSADDEPTESEKKSPLFGKHSISLLRYIAQMANTKVENLIQLDLDLFDVQRGTIGGLKDDFIFAPRIDDRICSFAAITSLIEFSKQKTLPEGFFNQVYLYDNEEIGSLTRQGAKNNLMNSVVERVIESFESGSANKSIETLSKVAFANSIILSADVNHLLNPNYKSEYLDNHFAVPNKGVCISLDPNGHMATDTVGLALVEEIAAVNNDKLQYFQIKNNARSGGTIGPSIASITGARTIDLGIPQLSMHSIRAATGVKDPALGIHFFNGFFNNWRSVYNTFDSNL